MNIGKTIQDIRKEKGMKQKDLSRKVGMLNSQRLGMIENRNIWITQKMLNKIALALDVDTAYIVLRSVGEEDFSEERRGKFITLKPMFDSIFKSIYNK
jgi:transcriptional regulator with XRE-family HTH domain